MALVQCAARDNDADIYSDRIGSLSLAPSPSPPSVSALDHESIPKLAVDILGHPIGHQSPVRHRCKTGPRTVESLKSWS